MPRGDTGEKQNKARLAEAGRGTYPIGIAVARKAQHVDHPSPLRGSGWRDGTRL
jgi:hypothetical protein